MQSIEALVFTLSGWVTGVILTATLWLHGVGAGRLTSASFAETLGPDDAIFVAVFAYFTLLGWGCYGEKAMEYLAGARAARVYLVVFISVVTVGAMMKLSFVWSFSDLMNGMMATPNLIALLLLFKVVRQETRRYFYS